MIKEPFDVLDDYFNAWKDKDWQKMLDCCQVSWREGQPDPIGDLKHWHGYKLIEADIQHMAILSAVSVQGKVRIKYHIARNVPKEIEVYPMLICEKAPLQPDPEGEWGVNPLSMEI
ncbi:MAG: hypothetical protein GTO16_13820 [Candidatus Aminicenantes bacterium]|nr:hypothetical protein [Candidatus Aminicenantes bacterium]